MSFYKLDDEHDYKFDRTNQSVRVKKSALIQECEHRADKCLSFQQHPNPLLYGVCLTCNGPKYAHTASAMKNRTLI